MLIQIVWFLKLVGFWSCDHVGVLGFLLTLCHYAPDTCSTCNKLWTSIELCIFGCDSGWTLRTYCCIQYTSEINFLLYIALTSKKWILVYLEDVSKTMCIEPFSSTIFWSDFILCTSRWWRQVCRICQEPSLVSSKLLHACGCKGSIAFVHQGVSGMTGPGWWWMIYCKYIARRSFLAWFTINWW